MSQTYTPTATPHGSYTLPSDGDPAVAESVNDALRDLADNALVAIDAAEDAAALAAQMINGVTGGSYSPSAVIEITSSGITLVGTGADLTLEGASILEVVGVMVVSTSSFAVTGSASFSGAVTMSGTDPLTILKPTTIDDLVTGDLDARGDVSLGNTSSDDLVVPATATFESGVTFEAGTVFQGAATFNGAVTVTDDMTVGTNASDVLDVIGKLRITRAMEFQNAGSGIGRIPYREPVMLPDADATLSIEDGELFVIQPGVTGSRSYGISSTNAGNGDRMVFTSAADQGLDNAVSVSGQQTVSFAAGDRICFTEFVYLTGMTDRADGWWPIARAEK